MIRNYVSILGARPHIHLFVYISGKKPLTILVIRLMREDATLTFFAACLSKEYIIKYQFLAKVYNKILYAR